MDAQPHHPNGPKTSLPTQARPDESPVDVYEAVVGSYVLGTVRLQEARIAALTVQYAVGRVHQQGFPALADGPCGELLSQLQSVSFSEYDAFNYVQQLSYLTYATSLLDCFLTETTRFLFLLHPGAMGKNYSISVEALISATTREDLVMDAASKKARELSYLPFMARIEFLIERFNLPITLEEQVSAALEHYSNLRNVATHDQNVYEAILRPGGLIAAKQKACPRHPTPVSRDDVKKAIAAYHVLVRELFLAVIKHVLKAEPTAEFRRVLHLLGGRVDREAQQTTPNTISQKADQLIRSSQGAPIGP